MVTLEELTSTVLVGTGVSPSRSLELAQGAEPVNETERHVAGPLRDGWLAAKPAPTAQKAAA